MSKMSDMSEMNKMSKASKTYNYKSGLAHQINAFIAEKRALGCKYEKEAKAFWEFDRFLVSEGIDTPVLPESAVLKWIEHRPNEKRKNQRWRLNFIKRFAQYLRRNGYEAYYPLLSISSRDDADFAPYIFSNAELKNLLNYFENLQPSRSYPDGHIVFPLLFKTLICCGLRAGEAAQLRVKDVDLGHGVLMIRNAKHDKPRYVPMSVSLWAEYEQYFQKLHTSSTDEDFFFPNARGNFHHTNVIYDRFREALWNCGIEHKGRGYGPRVHDLRHTFAVRCMQKLQKEKGDIVIALPYLSMYLGHHDIGKTQIYLRLIAAYYPEFLQAESDYLGDTVPVWEVQNEDN